MIRKPMEIRFAYAKGDKVEIVNGIYRFEDTTLKEVVEFAKSCREIPDWIELGVTEDEE